MRLDPTSLQLFVMVVEEGTIAAAAAREHIAPAAVSRRLSELEGVLHTSLFTRSNKGIKPTPAGLTLMNLARRVLHDIDDVYAQMWEYSRGIKGHVRIFANISAITQFLPGELKAFLAKHPDVQINLEERISTKVTKAVSENAADVGLFALGIPAEGLRVFPYREDELVLIVSNQHPLATRTAVSLNDILDFEFVGLHAEGWINTQLIKAATDIGRTMKLRIQVTGYDALSLMVEAGLGIGILPKGTVKPYKGTLRIKVLALKERWAHRKLGICVRSYEELSGAARLLVDHLRASPSREQSRTAKR